MQCWNSLATLFFYGHDHGESLSFTHELQLKQRGVAYFAHVLESTKLILCRERCSTFSNFLRYTTDIFWTLIANQNESLNRDRFNSMGLIWCDLKKIVKETNNRPQSCYVLIECLLSIYFVAISSDRRSLCVSASISKLIDGEWLLCVCCHQNLIRSMKFD